jgi:S1-C subfamily serine protease
MIRLHTHFISVEEAKGETSMADTLQSLSDALVAAVEKTSPSIVRVEARRRLPATGIVWSADGGQSLIVTANHVVETDENINVGLHDGSSVSATLVGRDPGGDVAVLRVQQALTPANLSSDPARVGTLVLAMGRPAQQVQVTLGVVSAIGERAENAPFRRREGGRARGRRWAGAGWMHMPFGSLMEGAIQTDVTMYPGFSGGPLVDASGLVHGINSSALQGVSITIPVARLRKAVDALVKHGKVKQGYLGIGAQPVRLPESLSSELGQETGLLLVSVEADSPAEKGGLFIGDIIVALDGIAVRHLEELIGLLSGDRVGSAVPVAIVRGGQVQEVKVTVGERS